MYIKITGEDVLHYIIIYIVLIFAIIFNFKLKK